MRTTSKGKTLWDVVTLLLIMYMSTPHPYVEASSSRSREKKRFEMIETNQQPTNYTIKGIY